MTIGSVVVPLDGSELAEEALPYGNSIATRLGVELHLVQVIAGDAPGGSDDTAREYLAQAAARLGDSVRTSLRMGDVAEQVIEAANEAAEALIVMTTRGRSGLGRWLYGSIADRVVREADSPVLLVRSGMKRAEDGAIHKIVVPLDGSQHAEAALRPAIQLTRAFNAQLDLVRVVDQTQWYAMMSPEPVASASAANAINEMIQQLSAEAQQYIAGVSDRLKRDDDLTTGGVTLEGIPADQILAYERDQKADLVVMSTHGRSGVNRVVFGSVAERVLRQGQTPVLMVRPGGEIPEKEGGSNAG